MARALKFALLAIIAVLILIQFVPVTRTNPPVTAEVNAPADVMAIVKRACYDCHSNETRWRWYAYVAPVSWFIAHDVKEGREHLNFSAWGSLSPSHQRILAEDVWEQISREEMPLQAYSVMHSEARLTDADKAAIHRWVTSRQDTGGRKNRGSGHREGEEKEDEHDR
jgi:hypothetical protein